MESLRVAVRQQPSEDSRLRALYALVVLGITQREVALHFHVGERSLRRWKKQFEETGTVGQRSNCESNSKFNRDHEHWIRSFIDKHPLSYLDEIRRAFIEHWSEDISLSTRIINKLGYTRKVCCISAMRAVVER
ncbi:hypothetical protein DFJ73DRAFT_855958 [Zopfochytrium polystomum]|nr:hypothetical protein DFJ73DRAFT_855958 [Zopfochytrium polystomum]